MRKAKIEDNITASGLENPVPGTTATPETTKLKTETATPHHDSHDAETP